MGKLFLKAFVTAGFIWITIDFIFPELDKLRGVMSFPIQASVIIGLVLVWAFIVNQIENSF